MPTHTTTDTSRRYHNQTNTIANKSQGDKFVGSYHHIAPVRDAVNFRYSILDEQ